MTRRLLAGLVPRALLPLLTTPARTIAKARSTRTVLYGDGYANVVTAGLACRAGEPLDRLVS